MMANEILQSVSTGKRFKLDPRTKMLMVITISTVIIGGGNGGLMNIAKPLLAAVPLLMLITSRRSRAAIAYTAIYILCFAGERLLVPITSGFLNFLIVACCGMLTRFLPGIMMGYFLVTTTTVSEFTAAMERMHMPRQITIPLSVMFRFFPTVGEEMAAINDAMKMRGITFANPMRMLEYRLVPMLMCSVKIGEELSAAALTRGLGAPVKRTNICEVGFHIQDMFAILICIFGFAAFFSSRIIS